MTEVVITRAKHPGRVAQGHRLTALMKKRKEEILRNKEQFTEQPIEQSKVQSTEQPTVQSTVQSNYVYGVGILAALAIGICVFFTYNKKAEQVIHEQPIQPKRRHML